MGTITILPETTKNPITLMGQRFFILWDSAPVSAGEEM